MRFLKFSLGVAASLMIALSAIAIHAAQGPEQTVVLRGKIFFEGEPPIAKSISMKADPYCAQFTQKSEDVVVSDRGLENVMVFISSPVSSGGTGTQPLGAVTLDQRECRFEPHVITLQLGQPLLIKNNDDTANNVHAWSELNRPFNESFPRVGAQVEHFFDRAEQAFPIRDDIHNWKVAFAGVFTHPYHTVSKTGGIFELRVPVGEHQITAWHERLGKAQQMVRVNPGENPALNFVFKRP